MKKYYVICGKNRAVVRAHTFLQACVFAMKEWARYRDLDSISKFFRVSDTPYFSPEDNDHHLVLTELILSIIYLNNYEKEAENS